MRWAFTIVEVLAAVAILGLVAAVLVPATVHVGHVNQRRQDQTRAEHLLDEQLSRGPLRPGHGELISGGDWRVDVTVLRPGAGTSSVARQWLWAQVSRGTGADRDILAERLLLIPVEMRP